MSNVDGWRDLGSIQDIAGGVRAGRLDPVALAERALRRAREIADLGAVVHLDGDRALRDARAVAQDAAGRLAGVPLLVKEIIAVEGMPFRCGSRVFADRVADTDAEVVRRARAAGAVIIGLSHSHEFAYGCTGVSNRDGPCRNPHDPRRMTGGSSAGSAAAVAAGVVPVALGTDTAGSVRIPAALCGVVGAKPGRDVLPVDGVFPLSTSLDHVGVLTGSVADARYVVSALAGIELTGKRVTRPRLGVLTNPEPAVCATEVEHAYRMAVRRLVDGGASLVDVRLPEWSEMTATGFDLQGPEAYAVHAELLETSFLDYQPDVRVRLRAAAEVPGWRYVLARARAAELAGAADRVLRTVDAVILPTVPIVAPLLDDAREADLATGREPVRDPLLRNNRPINVLGVPAISVPIPSPGLPIGLQVIAADDTSAFAVAEFVSRTVH